MSRSYTVKVKEFLPQTIYFSHEDKWFSNQHREKSTKPMLHFLVPNPELLPVSVSISQTRGEGNNVSLRDSEIQHVVSVEFKDK